MKTLDNVGIAATSVLGYLGTEGPACPRLMAPPVLTVQGTGLPISGFAGGHGAVSTLDRTGLSRTVVGTRLRAFDNGGVMGADQVQRASVVIPAVADEPWDPPRRTPPRC